GPETGARALRQGHQNPCISMGSLRYELGVPGSTCEGPHLAAMDFKGEGEVETLVNRLAFLFVGPCFPADLQGIERSAMSAEKVLRRNDPLRRSPQDARLVGRRGAGCLVLRVAAAVEALAPWFDRRPKEE